MAGALRRQRAAAFEQNNWRHCLETTRLVEIGVLSWCFPGPAVDKIRAAAGEKYTFRFSLR